jgi:hypothetical protein
MKKPLYMVFDVESVGLQGEGFAVGWVVIDSEGVEEESASMCCPSWAARGTEKARQWLRDNCPVASCGNLGSPLEVRCAFWRAWQEWKAKGATLAADVPWPVEARFLIECVNDDPVSREWEGPYPLIDIASVRHAAGLDPLGKEERLGGETPEHDPLADARQSARLLVEALWLIAHS